jgi:glycosyltransferase involved in cell wall biosynthesis
MRVSAIICTHNPKPLLLNRVLDAIRRQDLAPEHFELLVIDNASREPLSRDLVSWHPHGRVIREERAGLTHARLRSIREASHPLLIFIDDDNIPEPSYFRAALEIASAHPTIGAFCGSMIPEFEVPPPAHLLPYIEYLACSEVDRDYWSNFDWKWSTPSGAGLCVHRAVAEEYARKISQDPLRTALGRSGKRLSSGEDHDLALTATDLGLGIGRFQRLRLGHVIGRERVTDDYIIRLYAGIGQCTEVLHAIRPRFQRQRSRLETLRRCWQLVRGPQFQRRLIWHRWNAERAAREQIRAALRDTTAPQQ